jgi:N-acetylneuraminic acid mutarotase
VNQVVRFGEYEATILEATANRIKVQLPTGLIDSQVTIEVTAGEVMTTSPNTFHLISAWKKLKNIPQSYFKGYAFSAGSFGYVGFAINDDNTLWRYDASTDSWTARSATALPGENMVAFSNGTNGWAGMSERDKNNFQRYNVATNTWTNSAAFPGPPTALATSFTIGDATYVTNGQGQFYFEGLGTVYIPTTLTYRYSMSGNTWTQMSNSPTYPVPEETTGAGRMDATSFAIGTDGYVFGGRSNPSNGGLGDLLIYHSIGDTWESIPESNVTPRYSSVSFAINGKGYMVGGYNTFREVLGDCWSFNPATRSWTQLEDFPGTPRGDAIVFVIGNKAYFGSGYDGNNTLDDIWEFDPSKL